jgi:hypothetical protein
MSHVDGPPGYEPVDMGPVRPQSLSDVPAPGSLRLKEKRSWKTWQLVLCAVAFALIGMAINGNVGASGSGSSSGSGTSGGGAYTLPPAGGSTTSTTVSTAGGSTTTSASTAGSSTTTSAPTTGFSTTTATGGKSKDTTTTTASSSSSTTTGSTTSTSIPPARLLLGPTQLQGNWTSPAFTITAPAWNIGWAFQCTPAPTTGTSFEVFATAAGAAPGGAAAISETGASGQAVTAQTSLGKQTLVVQAPANCAWAVKVTGS